MTGYRLAASLVGALFGFLALVWLAESHTVRNAAALAALLTGVIAIALIAGNLRRSRKGGRP